MAQRCAAALSDRFRVLSLDPRGHGDSPPPPLDCRFDDIVQALLQLWDELGVARSHVVGRGERAVDQRAVAGAQSVASTDSRPAPLTSSDTEAASSARPNS